MLGDRPTRSGGFSDPPLLERLARTSEEVKAFYPELASSRFELRLSSSRRAAGYFRAPARTEGSPCIYVARSTARGDPLELRKVLAHEMGHLLQYLEVGWPSGEKACDLIWLSRCGAAYPRPPAYLAVGQARWAWQDYAAEAQSLAQQAWSHRTAGLRNYIAWWETSFRHLARRAPSQTPPLLT